MEIKTKKSDVFLSIASVTLSLLGSFLLLPFMMKLFSKEILAIWYIFQSIGAIVSLLDFGFSPTISRNVVYAFSGASSLEKTGVSDYSSSETNLPLLKKILRTCRILYLFISVVGTLAIAIGGTIYLFYVGAELNYADYLYAWIIYVTAIFLNMYFGYYSVFLRGVGAVNKGSIATIVSRVCQIVVTIALMYLNLGLIAASIGYLLNGLVYRLMAQYFFYRTDNLKERLKSCEATITFKVVWHNAWKDGLVSLAAYLSGYFITLICSFFLTLSETTIYSVASQFIIGISTIAAAVFSAFQPSLQSSVSLGNKDKVISSFSFALVAYFVLFALGVVGFIFVGIPLVRLIRDDYVFNIQFILLFALLELVNKWQSLHCSLVSCYNKIPYVWAHVATSVMSVIAMILVLNFTSLGMYSLIVVPLGCCLLFNAWYWPYYALKTMGTNIKGLAIGFKDKVLELMHKKSKAN